MAWNIFGRGRGGWAGIWPGRGPFSYLPPWQRPGWWFGRGRGWCWWFFDPYVMGSPFGYPTYSPYASYSLYPRFGYQSYTPPHPGYTPYPPAIQQYGYPYLWW